MYRKVSVILALVLLLVTAASAQVNVERSSLMTVVMNDTVSVTLKLTVTEPQSAVDVIDFMPIGWEITSWEVFGYDKANVTYEYSSQRTFAGKDRSAAHWEFKNVSNDITITYQSKATGGVYAEFITVWTYPDGFSSKTSMITVLPKAGIPYCGNAMCDSGENIFNCPQDCPVETQIKFLPIDFTLILALSIIALIITAVVYKYRVQKAKLYSETEKKRIALEDIRAYLKLGLRRGYQVREMIGALRGAGIDVSLLEEIERSERTANAAEEIKKLLAKKPSAKSVSVSVEHKAEEIPSDGLVKRLKDVIGDLEGDHEVKQVMLKLDHNGFDTKAVKIAEKEVKKEKKLKPKKESLSKKPKMQAPRPKKIPKNDEVLIRLKDVMKNLRQKDKNNIYKELKDSM